MAGKKGMSPLIATILLMAFAVALGAVIMNMGSSLPEGGPDCSSVQLAVKSFCLAEGQLNINMRNIGDKTIERIALSIDDPPISVPELGIQDSKLGSGDTLVEKIPFGFSAGATIGVIPIILDHGDQVACSEPVHLVESLPSC